jgi:hypothetical protein
MPEHRHPGTDSRGSTLGLDAPVANLARTGGSVTVGAPIGVGTCPFEIWSRACSASCCILLSGAVRSATAHLPERFSHSLIKSSIALTIELARRRHLPTTALACLTASLRSRGLSPRASTGPFLYRLRQLNSPSTLRFATEVASGWNREVLEPRRRRIVRMARGAGGSQSHSGVAQDHLRGTP